MTCPRCGAVDAPYTCSWFSSQEICCECQQEEQVAPNYAQARAAEDEALQRKDFNFPGIGLAPEDIAVLAVARQLRCRVGPPPRLTCSCGAVLTTADELRGHLAAHPDWRIAAGTTRPPRSA